jgi:hypothetical protein
VERLLSEAGKREQASDFEWFWWLDEYTSMRLEENSEDFQGQFEEAIQRAANARAQQKRAARSSAATRVELSDVRRIKHELARHEKLGTPKRQIASKIARKLQVDASHVRKVRKKRD